MMVLTIIGRAMLAWLVIWAFGAIYGGIGFLVLYYYGRDEFLMELLNFEHIEENKRKMRVWPKYVWLYWMAKRAKKHQKK